MTNINLSRELRARGMSPREIDRLTRSGELDRIRRGAYAAPAPTPLDPTAAHRRLIEATVPLMSPDAVLSHASAAVVHGLPTWADELQRVSFTRDRPGGGRTRRYIEVHGVALPDEEVVTVDGLRVTSLARTVLDLACRVDLTRSVAVGDAALRLRLDPADLQPVLARAAGRHGVGRARCCFELLDGRSESPEESRSRVILHLHGVPKPVPQFEVRDRSGRVIARCDFGWPELRTVGEFDGAVKYGRLLRPGQDAGSVVYAEKRREDAIRELGYEVVRWVAADLWQADALVQRIDRAFRRGRRFIL